MMLVKMHMLDEMNQPSWLFASHVGKKDNENIGIFLKGITFLFIDSLEKEIIGVKLPSFFLELIEK